MTFAEKIVRLRKLKGITQDEFASAVGVSRQAVYKWETGQSYPEVAKLIEIKLIFNISIDDLLDENYEVDLPEKKKRRARLSQKTNREIDKKVNFEEGILKEESFITDDKEAPQIEEKNVPILEKTVSASPIYKEKAVNSEKTNSSEKEENESKEIIAEDENQIEFESADKNKAKNEEEIKENIAEKKYKEEVKEDAPVQAEKKKGFFGRLFGRK